MKIKNVNYSLKNSKAVLSAQLILKNGRKHDVYFEVDKEFEDFIAKDASPFLSASLGISMKNNENLEIDGTVSKGLMSNTFQIMDRLESLNLGLTPILITGNSIENDVSKPKKIATFFSGGVDSFYTYLKNKHRITHLIFVHGFDINIHDENLYKKIEKNIINIAKKQKVKLIILKTNIRETFEQYFDWNFSYEFALASVGLFLSGGLKEIFVSCGVPDKKADHHFMSQHIDPLWSTENMKIIHYGCTSKIGKLRFLSTHKLVMENLRVCWVNKNKEYNCCECEKCFRNMLAMYVSDSLKTCKTFNKRINTDKLKNMLVDSYNLQYFEYALKALKIKKDTSEIRIALEEFVNNNRRPKPRQRAYATIKSSIRYFDKKYNRNRLYWYLAQRDLIS